MSFIVKSRWLSLQDFLFNFITLIWVKINTYIVWWSFFANVIRTIRFSLLASFICLLELLFISIMVLYIRSKFSIHFLIRLELHTVYNVINLGVKIHHIISKFVNIGFILVTALRWSVIWKVLNNFILTNFVLRLFLINYFLHRLIYKYRYQIITLLRNFIN